MGRFLFRLFRFLGITAQLQRTEAEKRAYINALKRIGKDNKDREVFDHLYECLTILDTKSSSMLQFNSIIIAVFAIFLTRSLSPVEWWAAVIGMAAILVSAFMLLVVVWVHWSPTENLGLDERFAVTLLGVRNSRTIIYRLAWVHAWVSLVALSVLLAGWFAGSPS